MRHRWILDVLTDLHAYACRNDLPGLADKVEAALNEALREIPLCEAMPGPLAEPPPERAN